MSFMEPEILSKGRLVSCDCAKCCATIHAHEWADLDFNRMRDAMRDGTLRCPDCGGRVDLDTFWESPSRNWYAGRYQAPGYLDVTTWHYETNRRRLERELRDYYAE